MTAATVPAPPSHLRLHGPLPRGAAGGALAALVGRDRQAEDLTALVDRRATDLVFVGPAGSGRTTVARLSGGVYRDAGVVPHGHVIEVAAADLVGRGAGRSVRLVDEAVGEAIGGVLYIQDLDALDGRCGGEVLDALADLAASHCGQFALIVSATDDTSLDRLLTSHPGLATHLPARILFDPYTVEDLTRIYTRMAADLALRPTPAASAALPAAIRQAQGEDDGWAGGWSIRSILDDAMRRQALRLVAADQRLRRVRPADLTTLTLADVTGRNVPASNGQERVPDGRLLL